MTTSQHDGLGAADIIAFLATTEPERAREFYRATLGLRLVSDDGFALVFDAAGTMLRIQKVDEHRPPPFTALGWRVDDIAEAVAALSARGVEMARYPGIDQDGSGIWNAPGGAQVAWFHDPDGNTLSLTEFPGPDRS